MSRGDPGDVGTVDLGTTINPVLKLSPVSTASWEAGVASDIAPGRVSRNNAWKAVDE
jgi:hypothetical protein